MARSTHLVLHSCHAFVAFRLPLHSSLHSSNPPGIGSTVQPCFRTSTPLYMLVLVPQIDFPIIADPTREVSVKYGMLDPNIKVPNPACRVGRLALTCSCVDTIYEHYAFAAV